MIRGESGCGYLWVRCPVQKRAARANQIGLRHVYYQMICVRQMRIHIAHLAGLAAFKKGLEPLRPSHCGNPDTGQIERTRQQRRP